MESMPRTNKTAENISDGVSCINNQCIVRIFDENDSLDFLR